MIFTDPDDGAPASEPLEETSKCFEARTGAESDFAWFCRACWREWRGALRPGGVAARVDDHMRRARAAKEAGVDGGKGGDVKSKRL